MSEDPRRELDRSLRRLHRSVLASLVFCALAIAWLAFADAQAARAPEPRYTWAALGLAALAILLRRGTSGPERTLKSFVYGWVASLLGAVGLGVLGLVVAVREAQASTGLLYTLAGALLSLRPPPSLGAGPTEP